MKRELDLTDNRDDGLLTQWMEGLQTRFESRCRRGLQWVENTEEIHDGGESTIYLKRYPVSDLVSVHVSGEQVWDTATLTDEAAYRANMERGLVQFRWGCWPQDWNNVRVVYSGGYVPVWTNAAGDQSPMPEDIRRGFVMQLGFEWRNRTNLGKGQVSAGGNTVNFGPTTPLNMKGMTLLPEVENILQPYRRLM